jgi:16S rRNA (adenine1518-N6/adenine1519-N6)-dimethyltransferase
MLRQHDLRPNKSLGQNFLIDETALRKVVAAADLRGDESVLEIGAGIGSLTRRLALAAGQVVAVEIDAKLLPLLRETLEPFDNVSIVQADILQTDPQELMPADRYIVVANIPYYITSPIIQHLLESETQPQRMILTVQREVAERICAEPGDLSLMALGVQVYGQSDIIARIPAGAFYPRPKVDSAVVRIDLFPQPRIPQDSIPLFFQLAKAGFSQKRKTLRNSLSGGMHWPKEKTKSVLQAAGIDSRRRAQSLSLEEWGDLTQTVTERQD